MTHHQTGPIKGLGAIVMAAGVGKRMRSKLAKVLHPVAGRPMVLYVLDLAVSVAERGVVVVVGYQGEQVGKVVEAHTQRCALDVPVRIVEQREQLGTGHAVMQTRSVFGVAERRRPELFLILNGDTPLLQAWTIRDLVRKHHAEEATVTILTALLDDPTGYGRVVRSGARGGDGQDAPVSRIVEDRDAVGPRAKETEINVGTYIVDGAFLFDALDQLKPQNAQNEYYLTDIVGLAVERGLRVSALRVQDPHEGLGINSRVQLAEAERVWRERIGARWMEAGVTLRDPATASIDFEVRLGRDTVLYPYVTLEGRTTIGEDCVIRSHTRITDSALGHRVVVQDSCVIRESRLDDDAVVGPFAHLRPGSVVRRAAKVGNFVEMKKTDLGEGSKANHLSYLGDATVGRGVNIGAGTITCNYDGFRKYPTVLEDDVFVGSDVQLIAPVRVGRGAVIAAGTTVTQDVPADALAIARPQQVNRAGWAAKRRALAAGSGGQGARGKGQGVKPLTQEGAREKKGRK